MTRRRRNGNVVIKEVVSTSRRRRPRRRRNRAVNSVTTVVNKTLSPAGPASQAVAVGGGRQRRRRPVGQHRLSGAGVQFLKAAFAPPDFSVDPGQGIPDNYNGMTLTIKDCYTTAVNFTAGNDTYIVMAPIPGYAYFTATVTAGTMPHTFTGVPYPTYTSNFGDSTSDNAPLDQFSTVNNNYSSFRYASMAMGLYPTSNYMNFSGSVSVWKADLELNENTAQAVTSVDFTASTSVLGYYLKKRLVGAQSINSQVPRDNYTESFIRGAFAIATDKTGLFEWNDFIYSTDYSTATATSDTGYRSFLAADMAHALTGFGNMETIIIKVSTPTGATNAGVLKMWSSLELKPRTDTALYQFSSVSPPHDPCAIEYYNQIKNRLPVAVAASENAWSWERVLKIMRGIGAYVSYLPGPAGLIGNGVTSLADGIMGLVL